MSNYIKRTNDCQEKGRELRIPTRFALGMTKPLFVIPSESAHRRGNAPYLVGNGLDRSCQRGRFFLTPVSKTDKEEAPLCGSFFFYLLSFRASSAHCRGNAPYLVGNGLDRSE